MCDVTVNVFFSVVPNFVWVSIRIHWRIQSHFTNLSSPLLDVWMVLNVLFTNSHFGIIHVYTFSILCPCYVIPKQAKTGLSALATWDGHLPGVRIELPPRRGQPPGLLWKDGWIHMMFSSIYKDLWWFMYRYAYCEKIYSWFIDLKYCLQGFTRFRLHELIHGYRKHHGAVLDSFSDWNYSSGVHVLQTVPNAAKKPAYFGKTIIVFFYRFFPHVQQFQHDLFISNHKSGKKVKTPSSSTTTTTTTTTTTSSTRSLWSIPRLLSAQLNAPDAWLCSAVDSGGADLDNIRHWDVSVGRVWTWKKSVQLLVK